MNSCQPNRRGPLPRDVCQPDDPALPLRMAARTRRRRRLRNERVIVFTLADGQRQVVRLDGRPRASPPPATR